MSVSIIINPIAGGAGRAAPVGARVDLARRVAAECRESADVHVTEEPGHAASLARAARADGARLVVAWGGDGTINEVASALAFGDVPLGIVPAGSGNGLARVLGMSFKPEVALAAALRGTAHPIDAGTLGGRLFVNVAGIGFDAHVAARFNAPGNPRRGLAGYAALVAREALRYAPARYTIATPDSRRSLGAWLIVLANGTEFGNRIRIAPHARVDDGALDLVIVEQHSRLATLWGMRRIISGTVEQAAQWSSTLVQQVKVESGSPMLFHVDGEPVQGGTTLDAEVHPGAVKVCY
jgi:diacylglycerol kinase (ATP)